MDRTEMLAKLVELVVDQLDIDPERIVEDATFIEDLGADSLDLLQLLTALEDEFELSIPDEQFESISTVGDVLDILTDE